MGKSNLTKLYTCLMISISLNLPACQKDEHRTIIRETAVPSPVPGGPASGTPAPGMPTPNTPTAGGTADAGGGNGIEGRPIESYRVDPTQLEAYKKHFENKMDFNLKGKSTEEIKKSHDSQVKFFNFKNWYIAPLNLKTLDNKTIGLSFNKDNTQQLAAQTNSEIWIDKALWDKLSLEDQATLIAHEYFMMIYLFRFESGLSLCKRLGFLSDVPNMTCEKISEYMFEEDNNWISKPALEPNRPLGESDYSNIRIMTSYFLSSNIEELDKNANSKLLSLNFDSRLFGNKNNEQEQKELKEKDRKLLKNEIFELANYAIQKNLLKSNCYGTLANIKNESLNCDIIIDSIDPDKEKSHSKEFKVTIKNRDNNKNSEISNNIWFYDFLKDEASGGFTSATNSAIYEIQGLNLGYSQYKIEGTKYYEINVALKKSIEWGRLKIEVLGIFMVEKIFHGKIDFLKNGEKKNCEQHSYTLNENGEKNYILLKSKFNNTDIVESIIKKYFVDYDCRQF